MTPLPTGKPQALSSVRLNPMEFRTLHEMADKVSRLYLNRIAFTQCMPNGWVGSMTYKDVHILSDCFAAYLREELKLRAGDRVAVQLPNCLAYPVVALGILKAGCVLVNTNPLYTAPEMISQYRDAEPNALVIIDIFADKLAETMAATRIPYAIVVRITDFFKPWKAGVIRWVQKHVKRQLPPLRVPHVRLTEALEIGDDLIHLHEVRVPEYTSRMERSALAVLQYTGGTTGVAKGAMLSHGNLLSNVSQILKMGEEYLEAGREVVLTALPLYHIFAFTVNFFTFFWLGSRNILIPSPRPIVSLRPAFKRYPITWVTGVNTLFNALVGEAWFGPAMVKHLKVSIAGGTALQPAVAERWRKATGSMISEGYGLSEASPVVTFQPLGKNIRDGSIGIPVEGTQVRCVDDEGRDVPLGEPGELWVKGPQVMMGYWQKPEETAGVLSDGWLRTGDVATLDGEGFFRIVDRKKDLILVSGFNVYPNQVEECIAALEGVAEVAVIGVPDGVSGEAVKAFVVPRGEGVTLDAVKAHCRRNLAPYKVPKFIEFRTELPKTPVGKILRKDLREDGVERRVGPEGRPLRVLEQTPA